jgi:glycosyltransferase involved in cell wall biosynthesis
MSILQFCGIDILKRSIQYCDHFIAISNAVKANLLAEFNIPEKLISLVYTFVDIKKSEKINLEEQHTIIRDQLSIPNDAFIVASAGTTDWRKGADLVVQIARIVKAKTNIQVHFIWMGGDSTGLEIQKLNYDVTRLNLESRVHFLGVKDNLLDFLAASDIFMLCSREEPVGIVALEAASLGKPVLCFEQAGGMPEFVQDNCGFVLPYLDIEEMANHIIMLQENRSLIRTLGENAAKKVQTNDINIACKKIESVINSVIEL